MGGIASLVGGNSAKADRKQQLDARDNLRNIFSYALPAGQQSQTKGSDTVGQAGDYFGNMLKSSRSQTQQAAAPALNANINAADAMKRREAITGTSRTGGTAEGDRMLDATTEGKNADIVNDTQLQREQTGAQGSVAVGNSQLMQAARLLGLSDEAMYQVLSDTTKSRPVSQQLHDTSVDRAASDISNLLMHDWSSAEGDQSMMSGIGKLVGMFF